MLTGDYTLALFDLLSENYVNADPLKENLLLLVIADGYF